MGIWIDLDDVYNQDPDLAEAIVENSRRYMNLFADVILNIAYLPSQTTFLAILSTDC